jgi:hypothetical protein
MLYWHPEEVRDRSKWVTDKKDLMDLFAMDQDAYQVHIRPMDSKLVCPVVLQHPDMEVGVMCPPELLLEANAALGQRIAEDCVRNLAQLIKELEAAAYHV